MIISMFSLIGIPTVYDESPIAGPHSGFPRPTSSPPSKALPRLRSVALPFQRPEHARLCDITRWMRRVRGLPQLKWSFRPGSGHCITPSRPVSDRVT